ncbi:MAG: NAD-dependent epimerase/dehydratase family protein [Nitrospinales bacterium]
MNICITGALGHIGSKLIRNLSIPDLSKVYLVDNFLTQRYASLFDLPTGINYIFRELDINSEGMKSIVGDCQVLIHLAAVTNAERSFERAREVEEINQQGLEKVAHLCAGSGCSLLFPSSTSVYGSQSQLVDETCPEEELQPQSPYAESKRFGEKLLTSLAEKKGLKFVVFRIGTIFGYSIGMRFHTAVNKFVWQANLGEPLSVWKTALNQKRPYCGLDDCVRVMNFFVANGGFDDQIYNIVTENFTVQDIIDVIREYIPETKIKLVDSPIMNQLSYEVSNEKSLKRGFTYTQNMRESVHEVLQKLKISARIKEWVGN